MREQRPFHIEAMTADDGRWPRFCQHAADRGIHSSLSLPLTVRGQTLGALNLYSHSPHAFSAADRQTGLMFAAQAAVALANAQTCTTSVRLAAQLGEALDSRAVIEQAKGILMARHSCDADEAFELLRTASQTENRKLRDVAQEIVTHTISSTQRQF